MNRKTKTLDTSWRDTPAGIQKYHEMRAEAQRRANETGFDHGIEANELFRQYHIFMLPNKENRRGFELRCEVVMPENLGKCQSGHGPLAKG
jgi:hypothetical protein